MNSVPTTAPAGSALDVPAPVPGAVLLHPTAVAAALLLGVNDHLLKAAWPGWMTGKLSDFAYCFLAPLVLFATAEWVAWAVGRLPVRHHGVLSVHVAQGVCLLTGLHFAALQLSPGLANWHAMVLQTLLPGWHFRVVADPTDLLALPMVLLAYFLVMRQARPVPTDPAPAR